MEEIIKLDGNSYTAYQIPTPHVSLLVITGKNGMLGCGYISMDAAEKFKDSLAVVSGVKAPTDMLTAEVVKVSSAAAAMGVHPGMSGQEALRIMG